MHANAGDPWQDFARELLQDAVAQLGLNARELAERLGEKGLEIAPKVLSRRINRGTFDAGFFLQCLSALGAERVEFEGERVGDVVLRTVRTRKSSRATRS